MPWWVVTEDLSAAGFAIFDLVTEFDPVVDHAEREIDETVKVGRQVDPADNLALDPRTTAPRAVTDAMKERSATPA